MRSLNNQSKMRPSLLGIPHLKTEQPVPHSTLRKAVVTVRMLALLNSNRQLVRILSILLPEKYLENRLKMI